MLGTDDLKNDIRSDTLGNYRTLLFISHVHKTWCFSFEAVKLLQVIVVIVVIKYIIRANDWLTFPLTSYLLFYTTGAGCSKAS